VAGVSRGKDSAANAVFRKLRDSGYEVYPTNPNATEVEGARCYPNLQSVPFPLDGVVIATHPNASIDVVRQAIERKVPRVWFHRSIGRGSVSEEAVKECEANRISCIVGGCPVMYCEPVDSGHRFLRWWSATASIRRRLKIVAVLILAVLLALVTWMYFRYKTDIGQQRDRISGHSLMAETPCGPIEYAVAGSGAPVLVVHGAGGGFDQGLDLAGPLLTQNVQVIAMSRFGYLRTPLPKDGSSAAQADAHLCLMNALGINRAAILGVSAGGPSAMQFAIRHPDRTAALILLVPAAYHPGSTAITPPSGTRLLFDTALRSDFLFWLAMAAAPETVVRAILGTPAEVVRKSDRTEKERVHQLMMHILPVSTRRLGLLNDAEVTSTLPRYELERITAPTLAISLKDDGYGTYGGAQYTAEQIAGARFISYEEGGHVLVGHIREITEEMAKFLTEHR
jgi:pimeloyl-ACP methyl ester carboxylesterase/predicted CoA-binding protein